MRVSSTSDSADALDAALTRRASLLRRLWNQRTDCLRLLHGVAEGEPGLTVDRYGPILLLQTGRDRRLDRDEVEALTEVAERHLRERLTPVWNHRPAFRKEGFAAHHRPRLDHVGKQGVITGFERGLRYDVHPRGGGLDPRLFLDLRRTRQRVRERAEGKTVLNLFSYTCGLGVAAAAGDADDVWNVDVSESALAVGQINARLNRISDTQFRVIAEDAIPALRQLAGLPVKGRGAQRPYRKLAPKRFDLVLLDPPRWAKGPFGAIDVRRDYPSLLKPALMTVAKGGWLVATNHVPDVDRETFEATVRRTAEKAGVRLGQVKMDGPGEDFPSVDGAPPLKVLWAEVKARARPAAKRKASSA